jgi:hypothetical protein
LAAGPSGYKAGGSPGWSVLGMTIRGCIPAVPVTLGVLGGETEHETEESKNLKVSAGYIGTEWPVDTARHHVLFALRPI